MNNLECILNLQTFSEAIIIGIITFIIGKIAFNMTLNKTNTINNDDDDDNKNNVPYGLDLTFFITGFLLHFIIEIIGINKWYCDKKCISSFRNLSKL